MQKELHEEIRKEKEQYKKKNQKVISHIIIWHMEWYEVDEHIYVNGNTQKIASVSTAGEINELNQFFNRFDCKKNSPKHRQIHDILSKASAEEDDFQRFNTNRMRLGARFSVWIQTKPLAQITLHHKYLRHVLNSLLTFFALYLMRVSPQILFQLFGKLHALCLYRNDLSYHPWMIFAL